MKKEIQEKMQEKKINKDEKKGKFKRSEHLSDDLNTRKPEEKPVFSFFKPQIDYL